MYRRKRHLGPIYTDVDQLPFQTLQVYKPKVEKPKPDVVIQKLAIEFERVRKDFGTSVASKRLAYLDDDEEEEEMSIEQKEMEEERMKSFFAETRALVDLEIKHYRKAFNGSVNEYRRKDEYKKEDQDALKKSDEVLDKKMERVSRLEHIRDSLDREVKEMVKKNEKATKEANVKLKTTVQKYREVIKYLEKELDFQRKSHDDTIDLFRNLERSLRETVKKLENSQAREEVLAEELKKTKLELHDLKSKSHEESLKLSRSASRIKCIEKELYSAEERAESAERSLCRLSIRRQTPARH